MDCMSLTEDKVEMVYLSYNELNGEVELERILL